MPPVARNLAASPGRSAGYAAADIVIRSLDSLADQHACVALQHEVWGHDYETVPATMIRAAMNVGALALGAFAPDGTLLGFVFGITGVRNGAVVHWSHMLGVRPSARDQGLGQRLKEMQRSELARRGIKLMYWTFDPLQARNAHLNINRLGARVVEYVVDMYGSSESPLHHAMATDRLIVECATTPPTDGRKTESGMPAGAPIFTPFPQPGDVLPGENTTQRAVIEIPWDLDDVVRRSQSIAQQWRAATRKHFQWALANQYVVTGFHRDAEAGRTFFVIDRSGT